MRELTTNEYADVNGGVVPIVGYLAVTAINVHRAYKVAKAVKTAAQGLAIAGAAAGGKGLIDGAIDGATGN